MNILLVGNPLNPQVRPEVQVGGEQTVSLSFDPSGVWPRTRKSQMTGWHSNVECNLVCQHFPFISTALSFPGPSQHCRFKDIFWEQSLYCIQSFLLPWWLRPCSGSSSTCSDPFFPRYFPSFPTPSSPPQNTSNQAVSPTYWRGWQHSWAPATGQLQFTSQKFASNPQEIQANWNPKSMDNPRKIPEKEQGR